VSAKTALRPSRVSCLFSFRGRERGAPLKQLALPFDRQQPNSPLSHSFTDRRHSVESCLICDSWNKTPHAKRFTTPIPPHYAEEAMVIGYWLGTRQGVVGTLCEKHKNAVLALDTQEGQRRSAPTTPPPPRMPVIPGAPALALNITPPQNPKDSVIPRNTGSLQMPTTSPTGPATEQETTLRKSFLAIAQGCATEYAKQHPALLQAQAFDPSLSPEPELITQIPPDVLRLALANIAEHCKDPEAAQFAARVLDGSAIPPSSPPPPEPTAPATIPCPLCHRNVKPGEVHSC